MCLSLFNRHILLSQPAVHAVSQGRGDDINATFSEVMSYFPKFIVLIIHDCIPVFVFDLLPDCCYSHCVLLS